MINKTFALFRFRFDLCQVNYLTLFIAFLFCNPNLSFAISSGDVDLTFNAGAITRNVDGSDVRAISLQQDGKTIIGGSFLSINGVSRNYIARLNTDGSLDNSFNSPLEAIAFSVVNAVALQTDGKIIIAGDFRVGGGIKYIVRLNPDGSLDNSFTTSVPYNSIFLSLAIQPDGKVLASGADGIIRLNTDGSNDSSFINTLGLPFNTIYDIILRPEGKILVGGSFTVPGTNSRNLARLNTDGSIDTAFSVGQGTNNVIYDIAVQPDGKIVAGGSFTQVNNATHNRIARFNSNGSLDSSFNGSSFRTVSAIAIQPDGKILVNGLHWVSNITPVSLARLNPSGSIDVTFEIQPPPNQEYDSIFDILLQPDGKILASGSFLSVNNISRSKIVRLITVSGGFLDFDGDLRTDISVFRPSNGFWYLLNSNVGFRAVQFGVSTDKLVPADYEGDGKTDVAVYRDGNWFILQSSGNIFRATNFGNALDIPVPADFDGDGKADIGVFRPSSGTWLRQNSRDGNLNAFQFGTVNDIPVPADYDGDGRADISIFRPSNGVWYHVNSLFGRFYSVQFGTTDDIPVIGDYDGDGKADQAVFRAINGTWYLNRSTNGFAGIQFGNNSDIPTAGDYDGDGKTDLSVFRPLNGFWYRWNSSNNSLNAIQFGANDDRPIPAIYLP